jgi:hypothetical protein
MLDEICLKREFLTVSCCLEGELVVGRNHIWSWLSPRSYHPIQKAGPGPAATAKFQTRATPHP